MILLRLIAWLGLPSWVAPVAAVSVVLACLGGAYMKGRLDAAASCREAALEAQIKAMERDVAIAKAAQADAEKMASTLSAEAAKRSEEVDRYEAELRKRPDRCDLTPADLDRLRVNDAKSKRH